MSKTTDLLKMYQPLKPKQATIAIITFIERGAITAQIALDDFEFPGKDNVRAIDRAITYVEKECSDYVNAPGDWDIREFADENGANRIKIYERGDGEYDIYVKELSLQ